MLSFLRLGVLLGRTGLLLSRGLCGRCILGLGLLRRLLAAAFAGLGGLCRLRGLLGGNRLGLGLLGGFLAPALAGLRRLSSGLRFFGRFGLGLAFLCRRLGLFCLDLAGTSALGLFGLGLQRLPLGFCIQDGITKVFIVSFLTVLDVQVSGQVLELLSGHVVELGKAVCHNVFYD